MTCYIVLGTPRSGTSLVAGVLHHLGVFMGERLLDANPMNPLGFYQDVDFEELFDASPEWMPEWPCPSVCDHALLSALVQKRCKAGVDWGVKAKLLAHALPTILTVCDCPVRLICTSRTRMASVRSLAYWSEPHDQDPAQVIDRANAAIEAAIQASGLPVLTVGFESLLGDPIGVTTRIAEWIGRPLTQEAVGHVQPSLRRF